MKQMILGICLLCLTQILWAQNTIVVKGHEFKVGDKVFSGKLKDQPDLNIFWDVSYEIYYYYDAKNYTHYITKVQTFHDDNPQNNQDIEMLVIPVTQVDYQFLTPDMPVIEDIDSFKEKTGYTITLSAKNGQFFKTIYFGRTEKEPYEVTDFSVLATPCFESENAAKAFLKSFIDSLD